MEEFAPEKTNNLYRPSDLKNNNKKNRGGCYILISTPTFLKTNQINKECGTLLMTRTT